MKELDKNQKRRINGEKFLLKIKQQIKEKVLHKKQNLPKMNKEDIEIFEKSLSFLNSSKSSLLKNLKVFIGF